MVNYAMSVAETVTVSVTAEDGATTQQYTITVTRQNDPPTAQAGDNRTVAEGAVVTPSGSGSDPEQGPLAYSGTRSTVPRPWT